MSYAKKLTDPRWQRKRLEIMNRDGFKCKYCDDSSTELHIHHLAYSGQPWEASNDDLVAVCYWCHKAAEPVRISKLRPIRTMFFTKTEEKTSLAMSVIDDGQAKVVVSLFEERELTAAYIIQKEQLLILLKLIEETDNGT